jgi:hypothetical protein
MPYQQLITRAHPTCIIFLVDQSTSMNESFSGRKDVQKAEAVADAINRWLYALTIESSKDEGLRRYFDVGVIGYAEHSVAAFGGKFAGRYVVPINELGDNPVRYEEKIDSYRDDDGNVQEVVAKVPVWLDPLADGNTSMCAALAKATELLKDWCGRYRESFPPIVINITDGASTDGDPTQPAATLKRLSTNDGQVLLFNCHISSSAAASVEYPVSADELTDEHGRLLFNISSEIPPVLREQAGGLGYEVREGARGLFFNTPGDQLAAFLDVGTRTRTN